MAKNVYKHPFMNGCEIPKDKLEDIRKIQDWLKTQENLPKLTESDEEATGRLKCSCGVNIHSAKLQCKTSGKRQRSYEHVFVFLHSNYYNIDATRDTITSFYAIRTSAPDLFLNQSPHNPDIQSAFDILYTVPLPKTTPEGYQVTIFKLSTPDPDKFVHIQTSKAMILFNDIRLSEDGITPGYVVVCDARGFSFTHLTKLSLHVLRVYLKYMQEAKPVRLKGLHVLYSAKIIDKLVTLAKPFMKSELQKMLKFHTGEDLSNFFKCVPQEIMPADYGGKEEPLAVLHDKNRKMMETKYPKWIEEEEEFLKEAMKLQNRKMKNGLSMEEPSVEPSFRTLSVD